MKKTLPFFTAIFFALLLLFTTPSITFAQQAAGIGISPATVDNNADPGQRIESVIYITNRSDSEQTYYIVARDIVGVRDGNTPIYKQDNQEVTELDMSTWVELPEEPYVLAPQQEIEVPIVINVPDFATPGDHFAGVFASVQPPKLRQTGAGVGYDVASIFTVKISGDRVIDAHIREFSTEKIVHSATNVNFSIRIQNSGTDLVEPHGPIEVLNMFGRQSAVINFNDNMSGVFPGVIRDYTISWNDKNPGLGRYQARISLTYETAEGNRSMTAVTSFWILPMNIIGPALGVLVVLLLISYAGVKLYIRRALREVSGGRRLVGRSRRRRSKQVSALMLVSVVLLAVTSLFLIILLVFLA